MAITLSVVGVSPIANAVTYAGENGSVAYVVQHKQSTIIKTVDVNGRHDYLVAKNAHSPVWSPNGRQLAFIDKHERLAFVDAKGRGSFRLHVPHASEASPAWSLDGSKIAFVRSQFVEGARQSAIFTLSLSNLSETNVTGWLSAGSYASPSWSPDGKRLVFEKQVSGSRELYIKNLELNYSRLLTTLSDNVESQVAWSPNGKKILYNDSTSEVYTIWPDGSHRTVVSDGESYQASWSPDGNRIVFLEDPSDESLSISEPDGSITYVPIQKMNYQTIGMPTWSPDGQKLLFTLSKTGEQTADLFALELNNQSHQPVRVAEGKITAISWQAR